MTDLLIGKSSLINSLLNIRQLAHKVNYGAVQARIS